MYSAIKKYCENERNNGLYLLDMPTGFGKTYNVIRYIFDASINDANKDRKYFFITTLKKNLPKADLEKWFRDAGKLDQFKEKFLFIDAELDNTYDFFVVSTSNKYIKGGAKALDVASSDIQIQAIQFLRGRSFYVLMLKNAGNLRLLKEALSKTEEGAFLSIAPIDSNKIEQDMLLQLLFNGLGNSLNPVLGFSNLTGHLYCFQPSWIKHKRSDNQDQVIKVPCLEIRITNGNLNLFVRTFTSTKLKRSISFKKKKYEEYPKYCFSAKNTLKRADITDEEPYFILRQTDGAKTDIPFLDIQNAERFKNSKMGVLAAVIERFNSLYAEQVNIQLSSISEYHRIDHKRKEDKELSSRIRSIIQSRSVRIVDQIGDNYSKAFCDEVAELFFKKYGIKLTTGVNMTKIGFNVVLVHNAAYYVDIDDPYKCKPGYVIQHITFEDFADCAEHAVATIGNELIIKNDLQTGKITLFDWKKMHFNGNFLFGLAVAVDESEKYLFINVSPDGSFTIKECQLDLFSMDEYSKYVQIFEEAKAKGETIRGLMCDDKGNTNIIYDTACFTIPEIDEIKEELINGNNKLRGAESRKRLLDAVLDIKWYEHDGDIYYFSGDIGEGMRPSVSRSANIRKIRAYDGSEMLFDKLAPLLDVTFVRNGQLTVVPFPFKYLREYVLQNYGDEE